MSIEYEELVECEKSDEGDQPLSAGIAVTAHSSG